MNGIHKNDQVRSDSCNVEEVGRTNKPYLKVFWGCQDIVLATGYHYKKGFSDQKYTNIEYRTAFLEEMNAFLNKRNENKRLGEENHEQQVDKGKSYTCAYCAFLRFDRPTRTSIYCSSCPSHLGTYCIADANSKQPRICKKKNIGMMHIMMNLS